jgi:bifunctional UDP-N-acetylglucosamine pyrophosphorylase/glucosamine-1-phosphate N-acetyltransferase
MSFFTKELCMDIRAVILAAGQGTRMKSSLPKVLHPILGKALVWYSVETARQVTGTSPVLIIGHGAEKVRQAVGGEAEFVVQEDQLGTGHAVRRAEALLKGLSDLVVVTYGDMPAVKTSTIQQMIQTQVQHSGPITMLTVIVDDPRGFGRVVRDKDGYVKAIVEEAQATPEIMQIKELNAGVYCFKADWLWEALPRIPISPKGEYYLTDLAGLAAADNLSIQAVRTDDLDETIGINTRVHLAEATAILRKRINRNWMLEGVTIVDPATTYIEPDVKIGQDTMIWPNTYLQGQTRIGENCELGPNVIIRNTEIGNHCKVLASMLEGARLEDDVDVGPFARLRKGAHLAKGVHMGNFGEVKNSYLGPGTKMGHFSYLGDTTIEGDVNIGAGTVTCNFDGVNKNHTEIGKGAFIGSDTMLVAPLKVGEGAKTGAGAVVTHNVPPNTVVVGVPARAIRKREQK